MLPDKLKETPLKLLLADQVSLPCEFEVSITVTVQDQLPPVVADVQGLPLKSDKPVGLTVNVGGGGGYVGVGVGDGGCVGVGVGDGGCVGVGVGDGGCVGVGVGDGGCVGVGVGDGGCVGVGVGD